MAVIKGSLLRLSVVAAFLLAGPSAWAQAAEPSDAEEMRREVRALKAQVQALRSALAEAVEFDRLRANALVRALGSTPSPNEPALAKEKPPEPSRRVAAAGGKPMAPSLPRRSPVETAVGTLRGRVEVPSGEPVAFVYVENIPGPDVRDKKVIEQVNKQFSPRWAVVQKGTTVQFPNLDHVYHNVFSLSSGNTFDLGLYNSSGEAKAHTFEEPGAVDVYCNIHPQMAASVLVVPNRYFAKVKADGTFEAKYGVEGTWKVAGEKLDIRYSTTPGEQMGAMLESDYLKFASPSESGKFVYLKKK